MVDSLIRPDDVRPELWVYLEHAGDTLQTVSLEILGKGRQLAAEMGWPLCGLLLGERVAHLATQAFRHGVDRVCLVEHPLLESFTIEAFTAAAFQAVMQEKPSILLFGATPDGRDLAARLAVRLRTGLNADCTELRINRENGVLVSEVSGFGGGVLALIEMPEHRPQMATVRPGVFPVPESRPGSDGETVTIHADLTPQMIKTRIIERHTSNAVDLTRAPVLVAGGRGVGQDFTELERLAQLLGGEVGATRPPVDAGLIERERQVGQTGVSCSPQLAICCAISGAFHFVVGIEKAGTVLAINSDPEAPIFDYADYCVIGDVHKILPDLVQALQSTRVLDHD